jgi:DNA repair exonuclease SbcCD ATPase subunit
LPPSNLLSILNHYTNLLIFSDNGRLNLIVQKDQNDQGSQTKDVKALSGGERSFTTLSLLLAIGESLETVSIYGHGPLSLLIVCRFRHVLIIPDV